MPITITITGDRVIDAQRDMVSLLAGMRVAAAETVAEAPVNEPQPEKPKATRASSKTKTDTASPATAASQPEAADPAPAAEPTSDATASTEPVTEESLRARATAYAAKGGPSALVEMQKVAGAPNGKMSEVIASPDAMTKLDALLADAGF